MRAIGFLLLWAGASVAAIFVAWQGVSVVDRQVIHPPSADSEIRSSEDFPRIVAQGDAPDSLGADGSTAPTGAEADSTTGASAAPTDAPFELDLSTATFPDRPGDSGSEQGAVPPAPTSTSRAVGTPAPTPRLSVPLPTVLAPTPRSAPRATPTTRVVNTPRPGITPRATVPPAPTSTGAPSPTPSATAAPKPTSTRPPTSTATPLPTATPAPTATPTIPPPSPTPAAQVLTFNLIGGTTAISFSSEEVVVQFASAAPGFSVDVSDSGPGVRVEFTSESGQSRIDAWWGDGPEWEISEDHD